jgi:hypothetical protein
VGSIVTFCSDDAFSPVSFVLNAQGRVIQSCRHNKSAIERLADAMKQANKAIVLAEFYATTHVAIKEADRKNQSLVRRQMHVGDSQNFLLMDMIVEPIEYGTNGRYFLVTLFSSELGVCYPTPGNGWNARTIDEAGADAL